LSPPGPVLHTLDAFGPDAMVGEAADQALFDLLEVAGLESIIQFVLVIDFLNLPLVVHPVYEHPVGERRD
jgi:hypothetical protein